MLLHPLFTTMVRHPHLVAEHLGGYAALAREEVSLSADQYKRRAIGAAVALVSLSLSTGLAGVAVMLGVMQEHFNWVLVIVPVVAALPAVYGLQLASTPLAQPPFTVLGSQFEADLAALRAAGERHES